MKFSVKVFLGTFCIVAVVLGVFVGLTLRHVDAQAESDFMQRYTIFAKQIGDTFVSIDKTTDLVMRNAVEVVKEQDRRNGLLSNTVLQSLRSQLGMAVLYITDRNGKFIRSDWFIKARKDPSLIAFYHGKRPLSRPLFSYCSDYKNLIEGSLPFAKTPIIPSNDTKRSVKFLMIPNYDKTRVIEADMTMNFIGDILGDAVKSDSNLYSIGLFTPGGNPLGFVRTGGKSASLRSRLQVNEAMFSRPQLAQSHQIFFTKIHSQEENCCECKAKGLASSDGNYYYILRTEISRSELNARLAHIKHWFLVLGLLAMVLSAVVSYFVTKHLVRRLAWIGQTVQRIAESNDLTSRLSMRGTDEVAQLAGRFDAMMEQLEVSQCRLATAEREKAIVEVAHQVAHDIRSPLDALEAVTECSKSLTDVDRTTLRTSLGRIREIAEDLILRNNAAERLRHFVETPTDSQTEEVSLDTLCQMTRLIVAERRLAFRSRSRISIHLNELAEGQNALVRLNCAEYKRVLSNLINNSVEAIDAAGSVTVDVHAQYDAAVISVSDTGCGMPPHILDAIGTAGVTYGKANGSGLGLHYAKMRVESWRGSINISSSLDVGTTVTLRVPLVGQEQSGEVDAVASEVMA